jgi:hypothetical protein
MKILPLPPAQWLIDRFSYDPQNGELRWKERPPSDFPNQHQCNATNARFAGKIVGTKRFDGYSIVCIEYQRFLVHRIIWKMMTGDDPAHGIDHANGHPDDNRWENLREADQRLNSYNARKRHGSPYKGVGRLKGKFRARAVIDGKEVHIGTFATPEAAHEAYVQAVSGGRGEFFRAQ